MTTTRTSTTLEEDSKRIEEAVMAEIRAALDLPPTKMISIPTLVPFPQDSPRESSTAASSTEEERSFEEEEKEVAVKLNDGSPKQQQKRRSINSTCMASLDGSAMNDSFMVRMAASSSSIGGSSAGISESSSQRFYIGTVNEGEEGSIQSHVSDLGADDLSHGELMDVVYRLYKQLKKADESLSAEKKRRHSREKNLIKLAKELGKRKEMTNVQSAKIEEMRQELRISITERELLEQRLENQKRQSNDIRAATQKQVGLEVDEVVQKYERKVAEHEKRISELNRIHAKQCEDLCREVVDANQEVMRLQKIISEMTHSSFPVDCAFASTLPRETTSVSSSTPSSRPARWLVVERLISMVVVFGAISLGYNLHSFEPVREMTVRMSSYMGTFTLQPNYHSSHHDRNVHAGRIDQESQKIVSKINDSGIKAMELSDVLSSNAIPGVIFDPTLPLKWLRNNVISKKGKTDEVDLESDQ